MRRLKVRVVTPGILTSAIALLVVLIVLLPAAAMAGTSEPIARQQQDLYDCKSGPKYTEFDADSPLADQVCPAYAGNFSTSGRETSGALYIVIHATGNSADNVVKYNIEQFQNPATVVSAHYIVGLSRDRNAVHVIQLVREAHRAYHAGEPHPLDGVTVSNANSIGIEVVGRGDLPDWPSDVVYRETADLVLDIVQRAKAAGRTIELNRSFIFGHEEIAWRGYEVEGTDKWDPGQHWDWRVFMEDYLGGTYTPAMNLTATLGPVSRDAALQVMARDNGRTQLRIERKRGIGMYEAVLESLKDWGDNHKENPAQILFNQKDVLPQPTTPARYCYRIVASKPHHETGERVDYINPSSEACVSLGIADADLVGQTEDLVVKPGDPISFTVALINVGDLTWVPEAKYGLLKIRGRNDGLSAWALLEEPIPPGQTAEWPLTGTAPATSDSYLTAWRMVYVDPDTGKASAFGPIITLGITVFPLGNLPDDPGAALGLLWAQLRRVAEQKVEQWIGGLMARLGDALKEALRSAFPWSPCFTNIGIGIVIPVAGLALRYQRKRRR